MSSLDAISKLIAVVRADCRGLNVYLLGASHLSEAADAADEALRDITGRLALLEMENADLKFYAKFHARLVDP